MKNRPLCQACHKRPCAINYKKVNITHYRSRCSHCIRLERGIKSPKPRWMDSGYRKKTSCEKCGFTAKYKEQLFVYHLDGNLNNVDPFNLRTICSNCQYVVAREEIGWKQGDLVPDY
jgi:hypothetical protein